MPFQESPDGKTYSCDHPNKNASGICDACIGKRKPLFTKEQLLEDVRGANQDQAELMKKYEEKPQEPKEELTTHDKKIIELSRKQAREGKLLSEEELKDYLKPPEKEPERCTHAICNEELKKGSINCCYCYPHEGCEINNKPQGPESLVEWSNVVDEIWFLHKWSDNDKAVVKAIEKIKKYLAQEISTARKMPYSVSEWRAVGDERGYFDFFEKKIRNEAIDEVDTMLSGMYFKRANKPLAERGDGGWMLDELRKNLTALKK